MNYKTVFTNGEEIVGEEVMDKIEGYIRPYYEKLKKAKIYKRKEDKEIYSEKRESLKAEIQNEELMNYLKKEILPIVQKMGREENHEFEIIPSHMDLLVYQKGGYFEDHIDFISNHSNITQQYTLLIGLENCVTGKTFVWDKENGDYKGYEQSIIRGGLIWFCSDTHHFSEKFEDEDNEKTVLSLSLKAVMKNEEEKREYYQVESTDGKIFYLPKKGYENTMLEKMYQIGDKNENLKMDLNNEEMELMRIYLENERELTKEEMEKIVEPLAFYMLIRPELKSCYLPSSIIKELNEKLSKNEKYILFDRFEPWMVEWSKEMNYIPFQVIYHCNDITERLDTQDYHFGYSGETISNKKYLNHLIKKYPKKDQNFKHRLEKRINRIFPKESFIENEQNYINVYYNDKTQWVNDEFVIMAGNGQYVMGQKHLGDIAYKMDRRDLPILYRMKQIIHNHQYQYTKREIKYVFNDFISEHQYRYYDSDEDKGLEKEEREKKRKRVIRKMKREKIHYGRSNSSNSEYESLFDHKRKKSSKEKTMHAKKILKNVLKENKIIEEFIDWNKFEKEEKKGGNGSDSDSDDSDYIVKNNIDTNANYVFLNDIATKYDKLSFSDKSSDNDDDESTLISEKEESSKEEEESNEEEEESSEEENEVIHPTIIMNNIENNDELSSETTDEELEIDDLKKEEDEEKFIQHMIKMDVLKTEENDDVEDEEAKKMFEIKDSSESETSENSIISDLKSDHEVIKSGVFSGDEKNTKIYRYHNVHFPLYTESFDKIQLDHEKRKKIFKIIKHLPLKDAYDYRENIVQKYYDEGCNEGGDIIHTYKFKVYYVFFGFIRELD